MLTDDEIRAIILACSSAPDGASEETIEAAIDWAQGVRTDTILLELVFDGSVGISMRNGKLVFIGNNSP